MKHLLYTLGTASLLMIAGCTDAGSKQTVTAGTKVILDATDSKTDLGGKITRYTWTQTSTGDIAKVHIFDKYSAVASFIAPSVSKETVLKFKVLTVESYNCKNDQDSSCNHHKSSARVKIIVAASDTNKTTTSNTNTTTNNTSTGAYNITSSGKVLDTTNKPISGALITANGKTITTKADGRYTLSGISTSERVVLNASHPEYFDNSRVLIANLSNAFVQDIILEKAAARKTFIPADGVTLSHNGASIIIPDGSTIVDINNKKYKKEVTLFMSYHKAGDKKVMQGTYQGQTANGIAPLQSFGFINMRMEDTNKRELFLSSKSTATIKFPVTASNTVEMPVWSYDAPSGYWFEDNTAEQENNLYSVEVDDIQYYGLFQTLPKANLGLCVESGTGSKLSGANINVSASNWSSAPAQTDKEGHLLLENIVAGKNLTIRASKVIGNTTETSSYPTAISLVQGETRDLDDCIVLGAKSKTTTSSDNNNTDNNNTRG